MGSDHEARVRSAENVIIARVADWLFRILIGVSGVMSIRSKQRLHIYRTIYNNLDKYPAASSVWVPGSSVPERIPGITIPLRGLAYRICRN